MRTKSATRAVCVASPSRARMARMTSSSQRAFFVASRIRTSATKAKRAPPPDRASEDDALGVLHGNDEHGRIDGEPAEEARFARRSVANPFEGAVVTDRHGLPEKDDLERRPRRRERRAAEGPERPVARLAQIPRLHHVA